MQLEEASSQNLTMIFAGIGTDYRKDMNKLNKKVIAQILEYSEIAKSICGFDINSFLHNTSDQTEHIFLNWISVYTCDYLICQSYLESGVTPRYLMGYSMGLITAMASSGVISYADGILLLNKIYHNNDQTPEAMLTIIGLEYSQISEMIISCQCQDTVFVACENNQYCFVLSGLKESLLVIKEMAIATGAIKVLDIESKFAFHSPLYQTFDRDLTDCVESIQIRSADIPIFSCIDQRIKSTPDELKNELIKNMYSRILWEKSICILSGMDINQYLEVGLGKSLTKVSKLINENNVFYTYGTVKKI